MALPVTKPGCRPGKSTSWSVWCWSFELCSCVDRFTFRGVPASSGVSSAHCLLRSLLILDPLVPAKDPVVSFMPISSARTILPPSWPPVQTCPVFSVWTTYPQTVLFPKLRISLCPPPQVPWNVISTHRWICSPLSSSYLLLPRSQLHLLVTLREGAMLYAHVFHVGIVVNWGEINEKRKKCSGILD